MIYARIPKSKAKKGKKAEREQYEKWLESHKPKIKVKNVSSTLTGYSLSAPPGRSQKHIPSLDTGLAVATKAPEKVYTGTNIVGIATMHKSNAVPVFNDKHAVEISSMRR